MEKLYLQFLSEFVMLFHLCLLFVRRISLYFYHEECGSDLVADSELGASKRVWFGFRVCALFGFESMISWNELYINIEG